MRDLIASKMERHPEIREIIKVAKENNITLVHFSRSDMYWGAHVNDAGTGIKNGQNMLGKLFMSHYDNISSSSSSSSISSSSSSIGELEPTDLSELGSSSSSSTTNKIIQEKSQESEELEEEAPEEEAPEEEALEEAPEEAPNEELEEVDITVPYEPITNPDEEQETDKLNVFYEMKNKYETNKYERCNKVMLMDVGSWKLKRKKYAMCKPKCINCNRSVGSIFSIKYNNPKNNGGYKTFIGKCGDIENPCPFNIELNITNTVRVDELYIKTITELNRMQKEVIITKNKAVFGMIEPDEAISQFNNLQKSMDSLSVLMERNMNRFFKVVQNESKKEELKQKVIEFNEHVAGLKLLISNNPDDVESIKTADVALNQSATELSSFKYAHQEVVDDEYNIIFRKCFASKFYTYMSSDYLTSELEIASTMEVINFNVGNSVNEPPKPDIPLKSKSKKKSQTKKNTPKEPTNKNKTQKNAPDINDSLNDLFQTMIIEDSILTLTANQTYKILEDQYKIKNAKETYKNIIRSYLMTSGQEWLRARKELVDVSYKMAQEGIPRGRIFLELKHKYREEHPLTSESSSSSNKEQPIDYEKKYKRVIDEMSNRYEVLLESIPQNEPKPKPDWPKIDDTSSSE